VSKLRENNKQVIGVGVKQSTSDLLIANCDEFIFYDDLVREKQRALARRQQPADAPQQARRTPEEERKRKEASDARRSEALELAVETFDALMAERGDSGKIWASVLKEAIKRRRPDFNENYFGFRTFGNLLEEAHNRGLMEFGRDDKSGAYVFRSSGGGNTAPAPLPASSASVHAAPAQRTEQAYERPVSRYFPPEAFAPAAAPVPAPMTAAAPVVEAPEVEAEAENDEQPPASYGRSRGGRRGGQREGREGRDNRDGRDNRSEANASRGEGQPSQQAARHQGQNPPALPEHDSAIAAAAAEAEARARARKARELRERQEQAAATSRRAAAPAPEEDDEPAALPPALVNDQAGATATDEGAAPAAAEDTAPQASPRRRSRGGRSGAKARAQANAAQAEAADGPVDDTASAPAEAVEPAATAVVTTPEAAAVEAAPVDAAAPAAKKARRPRAAAKKAG